MIPEKRMSPKAMKMRALIVDDEPLARGRIREYLGEADDVEIVGECRTGEQAVEMIGKEEPDLVFLDVQMPGFDGFEVVEAIGTEQMPVTIFVTAFDQYALRAFEAHALDYLLKPFDAERFRQTLERARMQVRQRKATAIDHRLWDLLRETRPASKYLDRIMIRKRTMSVLVRATDIDWIEAADNYVELHVGKETHLMRVTMSWIQERLDSELFVRIHRSFILNVDRIQKMEPLFQGEYQFTLRDGTKLTSSRGYRDQLREFFGYYG
jgi:two-component system, LytTR family, response regulator